MCVRVFLVQQVCQLDSLSNRLEKKNTNYRYVYIARVCSRYGHVSTCICEHFNESTGSYEFIIRTHAYVSFYGDRFVIIIIFNDVHARVEETSDV